MENTLDSHKLEEIEKKIHEGLSELHEAMEHTAIELNTPLQLYVPGFVSDSENNVLTSRLLKDKQWNAVFIRNIITTGMIEVKFYRKHKIETNNISQP